MYEITITKEQGILLLEALSREEERLKEARGCFDMGTAEREDLEHKINGAQGLMKQLESVALG